jgi:hypothetical protein
LRLLIDAFRLGARFEAILFDLLLYIFLVVAFLLLVPLEALLLRLLIVAFRLDARLERLRRGLLMLYFPVERLNPYTLELHIAQGLTQPFPFHFFDLQFLGCLSFTFNTQLSNLSLIPIYYKAIK